MIKFIFFHEGPQIKIVSHLHLFHNTTILLFSLYSLMNTYETAPNFIQLIQKLDIGLFVDLAEFTCFYQFLHDVIIKLFCLHLQNNFIITFSFLDKLSKNKFSQNRIRSWLSGEITWEKLKHSSIKIISNKTWKILKNASKHWIFF